MHLCIMLYTYRTPLGIEYRRVAGSNIQTQLKQILSITLRGRHDCAAYRPSTVSPIRIFPDTRYMYM